jgi:coproporphyrinogen III oxidase
VVGASSLFKKNLLSLPEHDRWDYDHKVEEVSAEENIKKAIKEPREWV